MIYNDFIENRGYRYEGIELSDLHFTKNPKFDLNSGFIPNLKTRDLLQHSSINKNIFKIMVSALQKPKRRISGTMTQILIDDLKSISDKLIARLQEKTETREFPTFEDFLFTKKQKAYVIKD